MIDLAIARKLAEAATHPKWVHDVLWNIAGARTDHPMKLLLQYVFANFLPLLAELEELRAENVRLSTCSTCFGSGYYVLQGSNLQCHTCHGTGRNA